LKQINQSENPRQTRLSAAKNLLTDFFDVQKYTNENILFADFDKIKFLLAVNLLSFQIHLLIPKA
jgi:hypothetical protein